VDVIPGVISPVAAASALREPLVEGREPLVIVPDGGDIGLLRGALALGGTVVIMKPSRLNAEAVALLEETGAIARARVTQDVSLPSERIYVPETAAELAALPYFSIVTILAPGRDVMQP
jgi:precorrin-2/cobalt-factor-2 C20-methyltransferase